MRYVRSDVAGGTFFFTVVTNKRRAFLTDSRARAALHRAFNDVRTLHPFVLEAVVVLPDHFHILMTLPSGDPNFSVRIGGIKRRFTDLFLAGGGREGPVSQGRANSGYRGIWQPRFWEHTISDARDFKLHLDYLHFNPLKHELVQQVIDWPWSSFHRYLAQGEYESNWAGHITLPHDVEYYWAD
jgi:putative transposase